nr:hypothetical protein [FCB group bacterium]
MRKIQFTLLILTIIMSTCLMAEERTFYLRSGDKITGEVMRIDDAGIYTVKTSFGLVTFHKDDIKPEDVEIFMKNGDKVQGVIIEESDQLFKLRTGFGEVSVDKKNIDKVDFKSREVSTPGVSKKDDGRWYYAEEQLVDIWFDPVGFTLAENELYLSGFSWAYGLTNRFQLSSKWYSYFYGDLNLRPKYMVFKRGDVERTHALSVG